MVKVSLMPALRRRTPSITAPSHPHPRAGGARRATRRAALAVALAAVTAVAAQPAGAASRSLAKSKLLWATVNVCDTASRPDTIGIRGAMPGSGVSRERMFIRFQLQYYDQRDKEWRGIGESGDSGFVPVGSGRFKQRQSGRNFTVPPPRTGAFILRGLVTFEWRRGSEVVLRVRERTTSKHGSTTGADPAGFSAAKCEVKA